MCATPLLLAAATLVFEVVSPRSWRQGSSVAALLCLVALPVLLALSARGRGAPVLASRLIAAPALLAPLAVGFAWTIAPGHLGVTFGGSGFFLHWLTRYPTWGPVNAEVLAGMLCVLGCAFLPWLSAILHVVWRSARITRLVLLALVLVPYAAVLIRLDAPLVAVGVLAMMSPSYPGLSMEMVVGPAIRLLAVLSMVGMLFEIRRAEG